MWVCLIVCLFVFVVGLRCCAVVSVWLCVFVGMCRFACLFVFAVEWVGISLVFSAIIGIGFGLYPAFRAANLQPVEALRTE